MKALKLTPSYSQFDVDFQVDKYFTGLFYLLILVFVLHFSSGSGNVDISDSIVNRSK